MNSPMKRPLRVILQIFGVALAICGFSFGVHSVRTPSWLHFRHAHAIIGIITFILTLIQFLVGLTGVCLIARSSKKHAILRESSYKISQEEINQDTWVGKRSWSIIHRILGAIVLSLGFVNISLGVFLAVLPLPVWIVWFVYMSLLVIILVIMEIYKLLKDSGTHKTGSFKSKERYDPRGTSQASLKYSEEPTERQPSTITPTPRRSFSRVPPPNSSTRDSFVYRPIDGSRSHVTTLDDMSPLGSNQIQQRQSRFGDVNASASLPERNRQDDKQYTVSPRKKSRAAERDDVGYYAGQTQDYEQPLASKASTISLEFGSNKHWNAPNSHYRIPAKLLHPQLIQADFQFIDEIDEENFPLCQK
ncbi:unnamed protein product [Rotaria socialis]|uniref:Cytochrome b561 domain-containing protein n=1 Tax=Rotaria socialis TaxID=392032 RepID=A0A818VD95_9BILA|nr:unnamed protein product [Rotaria socialis]